MGACYSHKRNPHFSINDLNGIEKYYSFMSKRKLDILRWMTDSRGPWKAPESFLHFKLIDANVSPIKISNEDEIRNHTSNSPTNGNDTSIDLNPVNSTLTILSLDNLQKETCLDWSDDW